MRELERRHALVVLASFSFLAVVSLHEMRNYGNAYDSRYGFPQGEALLHRFLTGRTAFTAEEAKRCPFRFLNLADLPARVDEFSIDHSQLPTTVGALSCLVLHQRVGVLSAVDAHNLPVVLASLGILLIVYRIAARGGAEAGAWAVVLCITHPRYVADSFVNYKDVPVGLFLLLVCWVLLRALDRFRPLEMFFAFVFVGLGMASKVSMVLGVAAILLWLATERRLSPMARRCGWLAVPGLATAAILTVVFWPFLQIPPFTVRLETLAQRLFLHSVTTYVTEPWQHRLLPFHAIRYFVLASPEVYLMAVGAGAAWVLWRRGREEDAPLRLMLILAATFLVVFSAPGVFATDGLRYVFVALPAFAVVGGRAISECFAVFTRRATEAQSRIVLAWLTRVVLIVTLAAPVLTTHPFEITYFNVASGGLRAAQARDIPGAGDYWAISYRLAVRWLNEHAEPEALLLTPFAPHLVLTNDALRPDFRVIRNDVSLCSIENRPLYLFYATRRDFYDSSPLFRIGEKKLTPVKVFESQGAPVLKIFREEPDRLCQLRREAG